MYAAVTILVSVTCGCVCRMKEGVSVCNYNSDKLSRKELNKLIKKKR